MTKLHPVSLHVIRGALIYSGFNVKRIRKRNSDGEREKDTMYYTVEVDGTEENPAATWSPVDVQVRSSSAFAADVVVEKVTWDGAGWNLHMHTHVIRDGDVPFSEAITQ